MKNIRKYMSVLLTLIMFVFPLSYLAEEDGTTTTTGEEPTVTTADGEAGTQTDSNPTDEGEETPEPVAYVNSLDGYATLAEAITAAVDKGGATVTIVKPLYELETMTVPDKVILAINNVTVKIPTESTVTVNHGFNVSGTGKLIVDGTLDMNGTLTIDGDGKIEVAGKIVLENSKEMKIEASTTTGNTNSSVQVLANGILELNGYSKINVNGSNSKRGILEFAASSRVMTGSDDATINVYSKGSIAGSASAFTGANVVVNNYGGTVTTQIANAISTYKNYTLYNSATDTWYEKLDNIPTGSTVTLTAPLVVNGNAELKDGTTLSLNAATAITVNGTLTVNGTINMGNGYAFVKATNLYGTGTIELNKASDISTYVTILKDVSKDLTFAPITGYTPSEEDIVFELGTSLSEANAIAAKIKLSEGFKTYIVSPKKSSSTVNGGYARGILANEEDPKEEDVKKPDEKVDSPKTGNGDLFFLGFISLAAVAFSAFCARRIYVLNRI